MAVSGEPTPNAAPTMEFLVSARDGEDVSRLSLGWRRWRASKVTFGALVIVGLAAVLFGVDWLVRGLQVQALLESVRVSMVAMERTQTEFERIALLTPRRPGGLTDDELGVVHREFDLAAAIGQEQVRMASESARRVMALPWHSDFEEARSAYLSFTREWVGFTDRMRGDAMELAHPQPQMSEKRAVLQASLLEAIPVLDSFSSERGLTSIFSGSPSPSATDVSGP